MFTPDWWLEVSDHCRDHERFYLPNRSVLPPPPYVPGANADARHDVVVFQAMLRAVRRRKQSPAPMAAKPSNPKSGRGLAVCGSLVTTSSDGNSDSTISDNSVSSPLGVTAFIAGGAASITVVSGIESTGFRVCTASSDALAFG